MTSVVKRRVGSSSGLEPRISVTTQCTDSEGAKLHLSLSSTATSNSQGICQMSEQSSLFHALPDSFRCTTQAAGDTSSSTRRLRFAVEDDEDLPISASQPQTASERRARVYGLSGNDHPHHGDQESAYNNSNYKRRRMSLFRAEPYPPESQSNTSVVSKSFQIARSALTSLGSLFAGPRTESPTSYYDRPIMVETKASDPISPGRFEEPEMMPTHFRPAKPSSFRLDPEAAAAVSASVDTRREPISAGYSPALSSRQPPVVGASPLFVPGSLSHVLSRPSSIEVAPSQLPFSVASRPTIDYSEAVPSLPVDSLHRPARTTLSYQVSEVPKLSSFSRRDASEIPAPTEKAVAGISQNASDRLDSRALASTNGARPRRSIEAALLRADSRPHTEAKPRKNILSVIKSIEKDSKDHLTYNDFRAFQNRRRGILGSEIKRLINAQKLSLTSKYLDYEETEKANREDGADKEAFAASKSPSVLPDITVSSSSDESSSPTSTVSGDARPSTIGLGASADGSQQNALQTNGRKAKKLKVPEEVPALPLTRHRVAESADKAKPSPASEVTNIFSVPTKPHQKGFFVSAITSPTSSPTTSGPVNPSGFTLGAKGLQAATEAPVSSNNNDRPNSVGHQPSNTSAFAPAPAGLGFQHHVPASQGALNTIAEKSPTAAPESRPSSPPELPVHTEKGVLEAFAPQPSVADAPKSATSQSANPPAASTLFGLPASSNPSQPPGQPAQGLFGASTTAKSSLFGIAQPAESTGGEGVEGTKGSISSAEGANSANAIKSNIFGPSEATTGPAESIKPSLFGNVDSTQSTLFGPQGAGKSNLFGTNEPAKPLLFGRVEPAGGGEPVKPGLFGGVESSKPSLFGTAGTAAATGGSLFGGIDQPKPSLFGQGEPAKSNVVGGPADASKPSLFGSTAEASKPSLFGAPEATGTLSFGSTERTSTNLFGGTDAGVKPGSLFGGTETAKSSLFGNVEPAKPLSVSPSDTTKPSLFGAAEPVKSSLFGAGEPAKPSVFGEASQTSLFGGGAEQSKPDLFTMAGAKTETPGQPLSSPFSQGVFGARSGEAQNALSQPEAKGLFGGLTDPSRPTQTAGSSDASMPSLFGGGGGSAFEAASTNSLFGNSQQAKPSLFGATTSPQGGLFGSLAGPNTNNTAPTSLFGTQAPETPSLFNTDTQKSGLFGATDANRVGLFGGSGMGEAPKPATFGTTSSQPSPFGQVGTQGSLFGAGAALGASSAGGLEQQNAAMTFLGNSSQPGTTSMFGSTSSAEEDPNRNVFSSGAGLPKPTRYRIKRRAP